MARREAPTFAAPARAPTYVPSAILVRFAPEVLHPGPRRRGLLTLDAVTTLPDAIAEPLDYLRENAGLIDVVPLFPRTPTVPVATPAVQHYVAAARSIAGVPRDGRAGLAVLKLAGPRVTPDLLARIEASPGVRFAEPLPARWLLARPDPRRNQQWGLNAIRYHQARRPGASKVRVAVLDTGFDASHPDLPKPALYRHDGLAATDFAGHGTHVAGIIAARTNNGVGIAGIADCELAIWKVFGDEPHDSAIDPIGYLRAVGEVVDEGVQVVNMSLGGAGHSQGEADLFGAGARAGVTYIAAMGNSHEMGDPVTYPAAYDGVMAVGAVNAARRRAHFSNTGEHIDLVAPGVDVLSTLPLKRSLGRRETAYARWAGTSMATPHVSAAAALVLARHPSWTPGMVAEHLRSTAGRMPEMAGARWTASHGSGLLNLRAALS